MNDNFNAEKNVLGAMLLNNGIILDVIRILSSDDFLDATNRKIFDQILYLNSKNTRADSRTVWQELHNEVSLEYFFDLEQVGTSTTWKFNCDKTRDESLRRKYYILSGRLQQLCNSEADFKEISLVISEISGLLEKTVRRGARSLPEILTNVITNLEEAKKAKGKLRGIDTGYEKLNDIIDGFHAEYIVLGARTGQGKTALALNMVHNMIIRGIKPAYFSLEMTAEECVERMIALGTKIQKRRMEYATLSDLEYKKITDKMDQILRSNMVFDDSMRQDIFEISAKIKSYVRVEKCNIVFIDHLSLIGYPTKERLIRSEQFLKISQEIMALVKELKVPIVVISQLGRGAEGEKPKVSDIRESGSIEQDAHLVMLLDRQRETNNQEQFVKTNLLILKNRHGPTGCVPLDFYGSELLFRQSDRDPNEPLDAKQGETKNDNHRRN